tara:strand:+ start:572 stop:799 length:228 start_codon:yes stop_codon:yes gene_type:complete
MAFKMKYGKDGFPYKSGFKHTGGAHEDHHSTEEKGPEKKTKGYKAPDGKIYNSVQAYLDHVKKTDPSRLGGRTID